MKVTTTPKASRDLDEWIGLKTIHWLLKLSRTGFDNVSTFFDFGIQPGTQDQFAIASLRWREGQSDNPLKMVKNAIERFEDKLSNVWLFAGSWAGDVESLHHVILQESVKPLSGILLARVKMQAGLVMLLCELDGLLGASAQAGSYGK